MSVMSEMDIERQEKLHALSFGELCHSLHAAFIDGDYTLSLMVVAELQERLEHSEFHGSSKPLPQNKA